MEANEKTYAQFNDTDEITIDLYELFYLFRQKLKYIILAGLIGALLVGGFTYFFIDPQYKATAKMYIVSASSDSVVNLSDLQIGTNLTADYKELILSRPMLESTIQNLGLDFGTGTLQKMLSVTNTSGTRILKITCTSTDPQQARDIANEMVHLAVSWLPAVMSSNEPNIVEEAILPTHRSSPSYSKNALIGAVAAAVLYYGICVVQMLMNDAIVTAEDMERYFGLVPLTSIPEEEDVRDEDYSFKGNGGKRVQKKDPLASLKRKWNKKAAKKS